MSRIRTWIYSREIKLRNGHRITVKDALMTLLTLQVAYAQHDGQVVHLYGGSDGQEDDLVKDIVDYTRDCEPKIRQRSNKTGHGLTCACKRNATAY